MIGIFLDWLLGPRCVLCGTRVFPADRAEHTHWEHPGWEHVDV